MYTAYVYTLYISRSEMYEMIPSLISRPPPPPHFSCHLFTSPDTGFSLSKKKILKKIVITDNNAPSVTAVVYSSISLERNFTKKMTSFENT